MSYTLATAVRPEPGGTFEAYIVIGGFEDEQQAAQAAAIGGSAMHAGLSTVNRIIAVAKHGDLDVA